MKIAGMYSSVAHENDFAILKPRTRERKNLSSLSKGTRGTINVNSKFVSRIRNILTFCCE